MLCLLRKIIVWVVYVNISVDDCRNLMQLTQILCQQSAFKAIQMCSVFAMDRKEFRAVIKHFFLDGKTASQIREILLRVHGTSTPSLPTISFWVNELKRCRTSTEDEPRSGRPKEATSAEIVKKCMT